MLQDVEDAVVEDGGSRRKEDVLKADQVEMRDPGGERIPQY